MYQKQKTETITLLQTIFRQLENASKNKLSTNDITPDYLLWEIYNKIFNILVICENCITFKDSLTCHLVARYTYEMLVIFKYIFLDKLKTRERMEKFLTFCQFKNTERMWTNKTFAQMVNDTPKDSSCFHKDHYRHLSNFAHPTMDSFLLNRRGDKAEFSMILNTNILTIRTILEIIKICCEQNLYFDNNQKLKINIATLFSATDNIMKGLSVK